MLGLGEALPDPLALRVEQRLASDLAGDPLADISVLRDVEKIRLVLKGGEIAADRLHRRSPM